MGHLPQGQAFIARGMASLDDILNYMDKYPEEEEINYGFAGYLSRQRIIYLRSCFHADMGNHKKAMFDLNKVLHIDRGYTRAREIRALMWAALEVKDRHEIFNELKQVVAEYHPDQEDIGTIYAWLAFYVMEDGRLGSVEDAKMYYEKCLRATARCKEIYGRLYSEEDASIFQSVKDRFALYSSSPQFRFSRDQMDAASRVGQGENLWNAATAAGCINEVLDASNRHKCLKCGKTSEELGKKLSKCGRCKQVSYCSRGMYRCKRRTNCTLAVLLRHFCSMQDLIDLYLFSLLFIDCQLADWKDHKEFCKM